MVPEKRAQTIVVCSPNRSIARLAEVNFRRAGATTYVVKRGRDAIDSVLLHEADVLFLDTATRDPGFGEVVRILKHDPRTAHVEVRTVDASAPIPRMTPDSFLLRFLRPLSSR